MYEERPHAAGIRFLHLQAVLDPAGSVWTDIGPRAAAGDLNGAATVGSVLLTLRVCRDHHSFHEFRREVTSHDLSHPIDAAERVILDWNILRGQRRGRA